MSEDRLAGIRKRVSRVDHVVLEVSDDVPCMLLEPDGACAADYVDGPYLPFFAHAAADIMYLLDVIEDLAKAAALGSAVREMPRGQQLWHVSEGRWATMSLITGGWKTRSTIEAALGIEEDK